MYPPPTGLRPVHLLRYGPRLTCAALPRFPFLLYAIAVSAGRARASVRCDLYVFALWSQHVCIHLVRCMYSRMYVFTWFVSRLLSGGFWCLGSVGLASALSSVSNMLEPDEIIGQDMLESESATPDSQGSATETR